MGTSSADMLTGTSSSDVFTGGVGNDTFVFVAGAPQADVITDFGAIWLSGAITGAQEVPPVPSAASGTVIGYLNRGQTEFNFAARITGLDLGGQTAATVDNVTAAHFHRAVPGVSGGVVFGFIGLPNNELQGETVVTPATGTVTGSWDAGEGNGTNTLTTLVPALLNNELYINFHTPPFPAGEIRGQMLVQDQGLDRIDVSAFSIGDFGQLQMLMTESGGSTTLTIFTNSQASTLTLNGAPMARLSANDFVFATARREWFGTQGDDDLFSAGGADFLSGEAGDDWINSGGGDDRLNGGLGDDFVQGMDGADTVDGGAGSDDVNGNAGADQVRGGDGADMVRGGQDNDTIYGEAGADSHVNGNQGQDLVYGGDANDTVYGGQGDDTVYGEAGDDHVHGDLGADLLYGGAGADRFGFRVGAGADWAADFSFAAGDRVQLAAGTAYTATSYQGQAMIVLSSGEALGLAGVAAASFSSDWVVFV